MKSRSEIYKSERTIKTGLLYWLTGLSGAGKTIIGRELYELIRAGNSNVIFLDGDILREVFGCVEGFSQEERLQLAMQYCRLSKMLTEQGMDVVCATISLFPECWQWNRQHIPGYREVYIKVPMDILVQRDQKQLYSRAFNGEIEQVVGVDFPLYEPENPDLILQNHGDTTPKILAKQILETFQ